MLAGVCRRSVDCSPAVSGWMYVSTMDIGPIMHLYSSQLHSAWAISIPSSRRCKTVMLVAARGMLNTDEQCTAFGLSAQVYELRFAETGDLRAYCIEESLSATSSASLAVPPAQQGEARCGPPHYLPHPYPALAHCAGWGGTCHLVCQSTGDC